MSSKTTMFLKYAN